MTTNKQETYKFLGDLVVSLMGMDPLFTFSFFKHEFPISDKMLVALKRGENEYVYQYVRVIRAMLEYLNLKVLLDVLLKELKLVLHSHYDLVVAAVPHGACGSIQPKDWKVVIEWDGISL